MKNVSRYLIYLITSVQWHLTSPMPSNRLHCQWHHLRELGVMGAALWTHEHPVRVDHQRLWRLCRCVTCCIQIRSDCRYVGISIWVLLICWHASHWYHKSFNFSVHKKRYAIVNFSILWVWKFFAVLLYFSGVYAAVWLHRSVHAQRHHPGQRRVRHGHRFVHHGVATAAVRRLHARASARRAVWPQP